MIPLKEVIHRIAEAPGYYYEAFFCPVKRATIQAGYSTGILAISWTLDEVGSILLYLAPLWGITCKVLAGLTLAGNFAMMVMTLVKRVRDWEKPEKIEGKTKDKADA